MSVAALASHCLNLQSLNLHCCRYITDAAIVSLTSLALAQSQAQSQGRDPSSCAPGRGQGQGGGSTQAGVQQRGGKGVGGWYVEGAPGHESLTGGGWGTLHTVLHNDLPSASVGLSSLNVSGCLNLRPYALQALCHAAPSLHTCPALRSLNVSGCMSLVNVHCRCVSRSRALGY